LNAFPKLAFLGGTRSSVGARSSVGTLSDVWFPLSGGRRAGSGELRADPATLAEPARARTLSGSTPLPPLLPIPVPEVDPEVEPEADAVEAGGARPGLDGGE
jgi:hypothetical protein